MPLGPILPRIFAWLTLLGIAVVVALVHPSLPSSEEVTYQSRNNSPITFNQNLDLLPAPLATSSNPEPPATSTSPEGGRVTKAQGQTTSTPAQQTSPVQTPRPPLSPPEAQEPTSAPKTSPATDNPLASIVSSSVGQLIALPQLNDIVRGATVNILCTSKSSGPLKPLTASGVLIDPRGVILLNAHTAQYFLLQDYPRTDSITCVIRTGNPARPAYQARVLYIPPQWVEENRAGIVADDPLGTGENDFALLLINAAVTGADLTPLPTLSFADSDDDIDRTLSVPHIVAGYAAGFLDGALVQKDLYLSSSVTLINSIFTFDDNTVDLMSLGGSVVAQKGSSGGPVVSQTNQKLVGLVVTTTTAANTDNRDLRAITLSHISRGLQKFTGKNLPQFLNQDLNTYADTFAQNVAPTLKQYLVTEIENHH